MHALIYQNFIQIFVEIPDMKAPRKAPYNHKNKTKKYLKMYHPYPFEFFLKKHFCLIPHLGTSIFPKEGHASLFAFMKDQPSKSLQIVKGILVVSLSMWRDDVLAAVFHMWRAHGPCSFKA